VITPFRTSDHPKTSPGISCHVTPSRPLLWAVSDINVCWRWLLEVKGSAGGDVLITEAINLHGTLHIATAGLCGV
jgi:hypothetical protein